MDYFLTLIVGGLLSGAVYALVGMAFVVVYRASSVLNFSLGEWVSLGARLTGIGVQVGGLPLLAAVAGALAALSVLATVFNRVVVQRLVGRPITAVVMATLALGVLMRAGSSLFLGGMPSEIPFPMTNDLWWWGEIPIPPARLMASGIAILLVLAVMVFFRYSRAGIAIWRWLGGFPPVSPRREAFCGVSTGLAVLACLLFSPRYCR
jgi:branched-chain amino acid transport system permease protein